MHVGDVVEPTIPKENDKKEAPRRTASFKGNVNTVGTPENPEIPRSSPSPGRDTSKETLEIRTNISGLLEESSQRIEILQSKSVSQLQDIHRMLGQLVQMVSDGVQVVRETQNPVPHERHFGQTTVDNDNGDNIATNRTATLRQHWSSL